MAACADAWITAASIAPFTERLKLLVALRPNLTAPAEAVRQAAALDRLSDGRAILNVATGSPVGLAQDGLYLGHTERYEQTAVAERLQEYTDIRIDTIIGSRYPHIKETYRIAALLFPKLNLPNLPLDTLPLVVPILPPLAGQKAAGRVT